MHLKSVANASKNSKKVTRKKERKKEGKRKKERKKLIKMLKYRHFYFVSGLIKSRPFSMWILQNWRLARVINSLFPQMEQECLAIVPVNTFQFGILNNVFLADLMRV